jgi:SAM-dependent methyltransferase
MAELTYNPGIFDTRSQDAARQIILTPQAGQQPDERWERETPYLADLLGKALDLRSGQLVVDYGCGIGRMAKALIERFDCIVLGVDISAPMRAMAPTYLPSPAFSAVSRWTFQNLVRRGLQVDAALSVWVLQHCIRPADDVTLISEALRPGARLAIVNNVRRAVPSVEIAWADDGLDIREILKGAFRELDYGAMAPEVVGSSISKTTFWAAYQNAKAPAPAG